jgi:hypothetical protein
MVEPSDDPRLNELRKRIKELNNKGTQVLIFLSFGIAATVLLWSTALLNATQQDLLLGAMRWWVLAIFPTVIGLLPLKEIRENNRSWYSFVRWLKFALLWLAIISIILGATYFVRSLLVAEPADNTQSTMLFRFENGTTGMWGGGGSHASTSLLSIVGVRLSSWLASLCSFR